MYATKNGSVVVVVETTEEGILGHSRSCLFPRIHWDRDGKFIDKELYPHFGDGFDISHPTENSGMMQSDGRNFDWKNLQEKNVKGRK